MTRENVRLPPPVGSSDTSNVSGHSSSYTLMIPPAIPLKGSVTQHGPFADAQIGDKRRDTIDLIKVEKDAF